MKYIKYIIKKQLLLFDLWIDMVKWFMNLPETASLLNQTFFEEWARGEAVWIALITSSDFFAVNGDKYPLKISQ